MIKAIRGMRDILPPDTARWQWVEAVAREVFDLYGYKEIRLPLLERTDSSPVPSASKPTSSPRKCTPSRIARAIP